MYVPSKVFFVEGVGRHETEIGSFEMALRDAGIESYNLVEVSSILPSDAEIVGREQGTKELEEGQIVHTVISKESTNNGEFIEVAVGGSRLKNGGEHGYLIELSEKRDIDQKLGRKAVKLAQDLLDVDGHEKLENFESSVSAEGEKSSWTTAVSAAVFIP